MRRLAYLFPAFPVLHQTFTLGEVLGLKRKGYDLRLFSLKRSDPSLQQDDARPLIEETEYCPKLLSGPMLSSFAKAVRERPADVAKLFRSVFSAWRSGGRKAGSVQLRDAPNTLSFQEKLLAVYHHNAFVYLLKSLVLVPYAIYLSDLLKKRGIGHVHAHWATYPATTAFLIREWSGIPYSFTAHAYDIYMISRMLPAKLAAAEFVVTCAETNRRYLCSLCSDPAVHEKIHLNYHGTDLSKFSPVTHERGDRFHVMSCGWLKEYKGFHYLLDSLAMLVERGVDVTLDLAGDGPQRAYLEDKADDLGIRERVNFHGYLGRDRLVELYRKADVFALPSIVMGNYGRQDVIPNVLAEAMAVGVPVIGSSIGGVPELIDDGENGLLVRERDARGLADALEKLWKDPDAARRLANAGREKVESIWDRDTNLGQLATLIDAYVVGKSPGLAA
jgi:glycosyltransferase involved in cell wall biosynthesis